MNRDWLEKDFYAVLGVNQDSSTEEIKKAYKKLARENHPDLNPDDKEAEKRFKDISEASSVLTDVNKRQEYECLAPPIDHGILFLLLIFFKTLQIQDIKYDRPAIWFVFGGIFRMK